MARFSRTAIYKTTLSAAALSLLALPAAAQVLSSTDATIRNSLCVGFDCANSETFGADTIRMKENNLRLNFEDTSSVGSFPTNDWTIVANDSANGGGSYLGFQDDDTSRLTFRVDAGAPANALRVDSQGDLGLGVASPVVEVHMADGDTPTVRLEQNGSSGFAQQTWDIAGNETNFFVRDATNGSQLPLRIRPAAPSNSIFIQNNGDIGMGTASPDAPLEVESSESFVFMRLTATGASPNTSADVTFTDAGAEGELRYNIVDGDGQEMSLDADGNLTVSGNFISGATTLTVPDYVFADDYALRPLAEVRSFIDSNSHLPDVPSAATIAETGLDMSAMQMTLLKKVEELTLYTLAQEEALTFQNEKMAAMQARLDALSRD